MTEITIRFFQYPSVLDHTVLLLPDVITFFFLIFSRVSVLLVVTGSVLVIVLHPVMT